MYITFEFRNGSNPYIAKTHNELFRMLLKYITVQTSERSFLAADSALRKSYNGKLTYDRKKELVREMAIEWQHEAGYLNYSYYELAEWQDFFETLGARFGLLREFHENCIC